jgi:hypothetical protein
MDDGGAEGAGLGAGESVGNNPVGVEEGLGDWVGVKADGDGLGWGDSVGTLVGLTVTSKLGAGLGLGDSVGSLLGISVIVGMGVGRGESVGDGLGAKVSVGLGLGAGESVGTMPDGACVSVGNIVVGSGLMGALVGLAVTI